MSDDRLTSWAVVCGIVLTFAITFALRCLLPVRRPTGGPGVRTRYTLSLIGNGLMAYCVEHNAFPRAPATTMFLLVSQAGYLDPDRPRSIRADEWEEPLLYCRRNCTEGLRAFFLYSKGVNRRDEGGLGDDICIAGAYKGSGDWDMCYRRPPWFRKGQETR